MPLANFNSIFIIYCLIKFSMQSANENTNKK